MKQEIVMQVDQDNIRRVFRTMFEKALSAGKAMELVLREPVRSRSANRKMWPMLEDVSSQVQLCINGALVWAKPDDWKDVFTAALKREQRMAQGIDGGLVILGARTSKMRKAEFSELIDLIYAFGANNGVVWSEPALDVYERYAGFQRREAA
jgi:hypothetical protein